MSSLTRPKAEALDLFFHFHHQQKADKSVLQSFFTDKMALIEKTQNPPTNALSGESTDQGHILGPSLSLKIHTTVYSHQSMLNHSTHIETQQQTHTHTHTSSCYGDHTLCKLYFYWLNNKHIAYTNRLRMT